MKRENIKLNIYYIYIHIVKKMDDMEEDPAINVDIQLTHLF